MSKLEIEITKKGQICIITLIGDAGIIEAEALDEALKDKPCVGTQLVVFDLSKLHLISSMAITVLINFRQQQHHKLSIAIILQPGHVRDALVRSRVIELFDRYDTLEEALAQSF